MALPRITAAEVTENCDYPSNEFQLNVFSDRNKSQLRESSLDL